MISSRSLDLPERMETAARATVCVCICTYKRPQLLKKSLAELSKQQTQNSFLFSVVIVDNDQKESARDVVAEFRATSPLQVTYCVEPEQNIALARNRAIAHANAEFIAFMDDDEFPIPDWLGKMLDACDRLQADGVLGPVRPFFEVPPPAWLVRGKFCERAEYETGTVLDWKQTRTGNTLFRRTILRGADLPFRAEFGNGGEDQDFFRRMMEAGHRFVWCNEAIVYEAVPAERRTRRYLLKRALQRGQNEKLLLSVPSIAKSLLAVPLYLVSLPFSLLFGQHRFMNFAIRMCDHAGKLLVALGVNSIRGKYLNG
jgi:succinoglycan biosynthesis protein ExoM